MSFRDDYNSTRQLFGRFLRPYWRGVALVVVLNIGVGFVTSIRPLVIAPLLEGISASKAAPATNMREMLDLNRLGPTMTHALGLEPGNLLQAGIAVATMYIALTVVIALLSLVAQLFLVRTRTSLLRDMTTELHAHLLTLPLAYFHVNRAGDLVSRLTHDVTHSSHAMDGIVRGLLKSSAQIALAVTVLCLTNAVFAGAVFVVGMLHLVITKSLGTRLRLRSMDAVNQVAVMGANLLETLLGIRVIKSFSAERYDLKRIRDLAEALKQRLMRFRLMSYYEVPVRMIADSVMVAIVLVLAFYAISSGQLTLAAAGVFFALAQQLSAPISDLFSQLLSVQSMLGGATRINEIFAARSDMRDGTRDPEPFRDSIEFQGVGFAYSGEARVLEDINVQIRRGEFVGVAGPSGSGKSTLIDLLLRLYDVTEGRILFDGVDVREFRQRRYRRHFGVVSQDNMLFNASVRENVIFNRDPDEARLAYALDAANATEFVAELPQGADTIVGDRGVRLSGGQRQRIALARALYDRPEILVLDEATSALDSESERLVQLAIDRLSKEVTMIVIAHRLSTIRHADRILVVRDGRIEAVGPHEKLLRSSPTYQNLSALQAANAPVLDA